MGKKRDNISLLLFPSSLTFSSLVLFFFFLHTFNRLKKSSDEYNFFFPLIAVENRKGRYTHPMYSHYELC